MFLFDRSLEFHTVEYNKLHSETEGSGEKKGLLKFQGAFKMPLFWEYHLNKYYSGYSGVWGGR